MSTALYIALERQVAGFDHFVNGKALAHAGALLDALAQEAGAKPLMGFFSASPAELSEFAEQHAVSVDENSGVPEERWFWADEGLATIRSIRHAAQAQMIDHLDDVPADLDAFERVLARAKESGVRWHLAIDY